MKYSSKTNRFTFKTKQEENNYHFMSAIIKEKQQKEILELMDSLTK